MAQQKDQADQHVIPYEGSERMSTGSLEEQPPTQRQIFIRKEHFEAFQMAVRDVNASVDNCIHGLRGEVFDWAHQLNQKLDISLAEAINAIGSEVRTSNQDLELRNIARQNEIATLCHQQALETDGAIESLGSRVNTQQSLTEKTASRCSAITATIDSTRLSIFDDLMENLEKQKREISEEMHESFVAINQRVRQLESKHGRFAQKIETIEQKTNIIDAINDLVQNVADTKRQIADKQTSSIGDISGSVKNVTDTIR